MTRMTAALLLMFVMVGCETEIITVDWDDLFGSPCPGCVTVPWTMTTVHVRGPVAVGQYPAMASEVTVELFDPANTSTPVAVSGSAGGQYTFDLGAVPGPAVCAYLVRAVLWMGETTAMQPLFDPVPSPCALEPSWITATALGLPAYDPLPEPFAIEGTVLVDGRPALAGEATVALPVRSDSVSPMTPTVHTRADGRYRFETQDAAQRFALCSWVDASVHVSVYTEWLELRSLPVSVCGNLRTLPDARLGTLKAAVGFALLGNPTLDRRVGAGDAWAELLSADGTVQGERFETLDDGSFHVWFPHPVRSRRCDWQLRITLASGSSEIRSAFDVGTCGAQYLNPHYVSFGLGPAVGAEVLELVVADPIGDNTGLTDLTGMTLRFDPATGDYEIVLTAAVDDPFQDSLRVNINLYNPSRQSFFDDTMNDVRNETPTTTLTLRGYHPSLRDWLPGDSIYTNSLRGTPNPDGTTLFRSGVTHFPMGYLNNEDFLAFEDWAVPAVVSRVEG